MLAITDQEMLNRLKHGPINWWGTNGVQTMSLNRLVKKGLATVSPTARDGKPMWSIAEKTN